MTVLTYDPSLSLPAFEAGRRWRATRQATNIMITLRCTERAAKALRLNRLENAPAGTSPLGDWYVNLVPTVEGGAYLFVNEQSLLAVFVPRRGMTSMNVFVARVGNILSMLGLSNDRIEEEIEHFVEARVGKTTSKRIIGVMNDLAARWQTRIGEATPQSKVSISDFELELANMPQATLDYRTAGEVAIELLTSRAQFGAV